jgi:glycosyltransferase involved in cell wall biosynthesis
VAAYGPSPYLAETLRSLVDAVPPAVAITVQDDATPDDAVRQQTAPFTPRVAYRRLERNQGVSGAFNAAADAATASHLVLVGPDDRALSGFADIYLSGVRAHPEAVAVHPGVATVDAGGVRALPLSDRVKGLLRPGLGPQSGSRLAASLLAGNWTYNPAIAWRVDFVRQQRFRTDLRMAMDLELLLRLAFTDEVLALVPGEALEYRRHAESVSSVGAGQVRLREELEIHAWAARECDQRGWRATATVARLAPTARLHAVLVAMRAQTSDRNRTLGLAVRPVNRV